MENLTETKLKVVLTPMPVFVVRESTDKTRLAPNPAAKDQETTLTSIKTRNGGLSEAMMHGGAI